MKLAEALIKRSDLQKYVKQYKHRLAKCATVQEGLEPVEDPQKLVAKAEQAIAELEDAGFEYETYDLFGVSPLNRVATQDPEGGSQAPKGSVIELGLV